MTIIPPTPPKVYTPNPADHYTTGTKIWTGIVGTALVMEAYGLYRDHKEPGNRGKWTLSSNWYTATGWDSVTGVPIDVKFGNTRRAAGVMFLAWLTWHWTAKRPSLSAKP